MDTDEEESASYVPGESTVQSFSAKHFDSGQPVRLGFYITYREFRQRFRNAKGC
jgi:hypothetical protein